MPVQSFFDRMANNQIPIRSLADRFWPKVKICNLNECWLWQAGFDKAGYGKVGGELPERRTLRAPRVAWELTYGPIPDGKLVRHSCDNPPCCNPRHLRLGTDQSNSQDRTARGRVPRGSQLPHAKLTEAQVKRIRATGGKERFGMSGATISLILRRKLWTHI